jgi:diphthine methyl ester acylhydrolase
MVVCCIAQNPVEGNMLLTGSYDEFLRVWDMRLMKKPVNEISINLGGGV